MKIALSPLVFCLLFHAAGAAWLCQGSAVCGLTGFLTAPNNSPPCAISTILVTLQQLEEAAAQRRPVLLCIWAMASKTSSAGIFVTKKIKLFSRKPSCHWWFHLCRSEAETSGPAWSLWCPREGFSGTLELVKLSRWSWRTTMCPWGPSPKTGPRQLTLHGTNVKHVSFLDYYF